MHDSYEYSVLTLNKLISKSNVIDNSVLQGPEAQLQHLPPTQGKEVKLQRTKMFCERAVVKLTEIDKLKVIHVAGTKGKGSTSTFVDAILHKQGYKTGLFTSPHLMEVRERIKINGSTVSKSYFANHFWHIYDNLYNSKCSPEDMPSYFQFLTIMAFHIFLEEKVDYVILETGIGGRFDHTNIISNSKISCITSLGFDHIQSLGHTMKEIAWHKAGIIKPGSIVVTCDNQPQDGMDVIVAETQTHNNKLYLVPIKTTQNPQSVLKYDKNIHPENAVLAAAVCGILLNANDNSEGTQYEGDASNILHLPIPFCTRNEYMEIIHSTKMLGRYQIIKKGNIDFFIDGAHTVESMATCVEWFKEVSVMRKCTRRFLVFMVTGPRSVEGLLLQLPQLKFDGILLTPLIPFRQNQPPDFAPDDTIIAREKDKLAEIAATWTRLNLEFDNSKQSVEYFNCFEEIDGWLSTAGENVQVLVVGSLHLVGCALAVLGNGDIN